MNYYSNIVEGYDELYKEEQFEKLKLLSQFFKPKGLILDIGAGTGIVEKYFKDFEVYSMDPSEEMLKYCKRNKYVGYAESMPFEDNKFDTIISLTALHHVKDIDKAIKEIKRVAKPKAIFAFTILKKANNADDWIKLLIKEFKLELLDSKKDFILFSSFS